MVCLRCVVHNGGCPTDVWQGWNTGFCSRTLRESSAYFQVVRTLVSLEQLSTQYEKNDGWHIILDSKQKKVVSFDDVFWKRYWIRSHQVSWLYCYRPVSSVHWIYIANLAPIPEKSLIVMHIRTDRQKALETGKLKGVMNHEHSWRLKFSLVVWQTYRSSWHPHTLFPFFK